MPNTHQWRIAAARSAALCAMLLATMPSCGWGQQAGGGAASADNATLQALLSEVRQLRLALERSTSLVPRIELAARRLQMQQDRVDRLNRELRDFRNQMARNGAERDRLAAQLKQLEGDTGQAQDPNRRKEVEQIIKQLTGELEQQAVNAQQERGQEIDLMSQIQTEQATLIGLSDQLNALDKKLQEGSQR